MKNLLRAFVLICCIVPWMPSVVAADDTIYCPTDPAQLKARCDKTGQDIRSLEPKIQNTERTLQNSNNVFFDSTHKGYYRHDGSWINFTAFRDAALNKHFVMMTRQQLADFISATYGSRNKYAFQTRFNNAINTSNQRRGELLGFSGNLAQWKHTLQQLYIFKAQCCGGRWDTGGPLYDNPPPGRNPPGPGGGGNTIKLFDINAPPSR